MKKGKEVKDKREEPEEEPRKGKIRGDPLVEVEW